MRNDRTLAALAASTVLALGAPAWGADDDSQFVKEAASGGMLEVELGKHAAAHAADPQVRAFGERMAADHAKANQQLKSVAQRSGIALPSQMSAEHRETLEELAKLRGAELDQAYMEAMVEDHQRDVDAFRAQAGEKKSEVDRWAAETLPTLEAHLKQAKSVAERVEGAGTLGSASGRDLGR